MHVTLAGIISDKKTLVTKKNNLMAFIQLEDLVGSIEVIVFPNIYERYRDLINEDSIVVIKGTINCKEDEAPKILADQIYPLEGYKEANLSTAENKDTSCDGRGICIGGNKGYLQSILVIHRY